MKEQEMRAAQVTTWRKYTQAEKQAYRARQARRAQNGLDSEWRDFLATRHHYADNFGRTVPTVTPRDGLL